MFALENKRDKEVYIGLSQEEVEAKVNELGLKNDEWFAHLCI